MEKELINLGSRNRPGLMELQEPLTSRRQRTLSLPAAKNRFSSLINRIGDFVETWKISTHPLLPNEEQALRKNYKEIKSLEVELITTAEVLTGLLTGQGSMQ